MQIDPALHRYLEILAHHAAGGVTEVSIAPGSQTALVGYFDTVEKAARALAAHNGKDNVYVTLNPVKQDLLGRVNNKLAKCKNRTADADILCDCWFFFDIDPKRPSGISSTNTELQEAISVGKQIVRYLLDIGVTQESILTGMSGNGVYVLVRLPDYEITRERTELKKRLLNFFADQFSTATIEIDRTVYNPARLVAALGTLKMKGESITERPHRRSKIRTIAGVSFDPSLIQRCEPFNLYALADVLLPPETKRKSNLKASSNGQSLDVEQWMAKHSLDVASVKPWRGTGFSGRLYVLRACPFNPDHDKSAFIIQADNGALSFGCHHNSCANYGWRELRILYEPERMSVGTESNAGKESHSFSGSNIDNADEFLNVATWPAPLAPEALYGLAGDVVCAIEPHSEADPAALLVQFLTMFGNVIGRSAHFIAEADRHYTNIFTTLVGATAKGRKGTSQGQIQNLFNSVDEDWGRNRVQSGLSSGEGLIWAVRDPVEKTEPIREKKKITGYQKVIIDQGVEDKRLLAFEGELASTLRVLGRDGNTLSALIRQAWDKGDLRVLTKNNPAQATSAHISIIGHITRDELRRYLDTTEAGNGFANRFLWVCVRRSKSLPFGGRLQEVKILPIIKRLSEAVISARSMKELKRDDEANALWAEIYDELSEGKPGLLGAIISRAEPQVMRLACLYALLDCSAVICRRHLKAGLALWRYCEESAQFIFGDSLGDPVADEILRALRQAVSGMTRTEIRDLFGRHRNAREISRALTTLSEQGLVSSIQEETEGRPAERWFAASRPATKATKATKDIFEEPEAKASVANVAYVAPTVPEDVASDGWGEV